MKKPLVGALFAVLLLGAGTAPAAAATSHDATAPGTFKAASAARVAADAASSGHAATQTKVRPKAIGFAGTVALSNCSGSVVRTPDSQPGDPALVLSNGHCMESGFPGPGEVVFNQPSTRSFTLLNAAGSGVGTVRASKIAYGTMTDTDISVYQLTSTYAQIESTYGIKALELNTAHPVQGTAITVVSGYWKRTYSCNVDGFVYRLKEGSGPGRTRSATPPPARPSAVRPARR